jgi:hypothetical protein
MNWSKKIAERFKIAFQKKFNFAADFAIAKK